MKRRLPVLAGVVAALAAVCIVTTAGLGIAQRLGWPAAEKLRNIAKYHPLLAPAAPTRTLRYIGTNLLRLSLTSYNLTALNGGFASGGGAILPLGDGIIILDRHGAFFRFRRSGDQATLARLPMSINTNNDAYENYARAQGYAIRPGTNVGFAGLGMRVHDLALLKDAKLLAASYTYWRDDRNCAELRLALKDITAGPDTTAAASWRVLFRSSPCLGLSDKKSKPFAGHQAGGRIYQHKPGHVLFSVGDFKRDGVHGPAIIIDPQTDYGKILEINLTTGEKRIYSSGHRNPQGLTGDDQGRVWSSEHGPTGGDELNQIIDGADYGWPRVTLGKSCQSCDWQLQGRHDGYRYPVYAWLPSIGVSNLVVLDQFSPLWDGDIMVASLVQETLHHLRLHEGRVIFDEPILIGERLRDLAQDPSGALALLADSGKLMFLEAETPSPPPQRLADDFTPEALEAINDCAECHGMEAGQGRAGSITLWGVFGRRKAAAAPPDLYSDALKSQGGIWDVDSLDEFLKDPSKAVPGTSMAIDGIIDDEQRLQIIRYLERLR